MVEILGVNYGRHPFTEPRLDSAGSTTRLVLLLSMGAGSLMGSFSTCIKHKQTWNNLGTITPKHRGKRGAGPTSKQDESTT